MSVIDKTLFEEQYDLLYRAVYPIDNCTKDNLGMTVRPVVDRAKDLNGQNQCNFTIPEGDKKNNANEKFNFLHIIVLRLLMHYQRLFHKFFCLLDPNHPNQQSYSLK